MAGQHNPRQCCTVVQTFHFDTVRTASHSESIALKWCIERELELLSRNLILSLSVPADACLHSSFSMKHVHEDLIPL